MQDDRPARPKWFSPTAQCSHCKSWKTRIISLYAAKRIRTHQCLACERTFKTAMAEHKAKSVSTPLRPPVPWSRVQDLAKKAGMSANAMGNRLRNGWTEEEAVSIPLGVRRKPVIGE